MHFLVNWIDLGHLNYRGKHLITSSDSLALSLFLILFWSDLGNNKKVMRWDFFMPFVKYGKLYGTAFLFVIELFPPNTSKIHLFHQL